MGEGGRRSVPSDGNQKLPKSPHFTLQRAPCEKPPFTVGDIKKAIPPHCFRRSLLRSSYYLIRDLVLVSLLYYAATTYIPLLPQTLSYAAWPLYWFCLGCILTGLWAIAHECGHHGFSEYHWLNDTIGMILHSALLVPYFSWKYSHQRHHSNTGSMDKDEVFVPKLKSDALLYSKLTNNPPGTVLRLLVLLLVGWPLYIFFNLSGRAYDRFACHFNPYSPIFNDRERLQVFITDAGVLGTMSLLYYYAQAKGLAWVVCVYGVPWLVVHGWVVLITYLQHTHPSLPHYDSSEWDWLRGALSTVDRDYGTILNSVFHHIVDTHVVHHLFSTIPHYHAEEATRAIKSVLGEYYQYDGTPILKAMWREAEHCVYVEPTNKKKGVFWYENKI